MENSSILQSTFRLRNQTIKKQLNSLGNSKINNNNQDLQISKLLDIHENDNSVNNKDIENFRQSKLTFIQSHMLDPNIQLDNNSLSILNQNAINKTFEDSQYDPDKAPPDLNFAQEHGKAWRVCQQIDQKNINLRRCECCSKVIDNELIPMCDSPNKMVHFGTAYPIYFVFMKQTAIFMFIHLCISSLPAIFIYRTGNFCQKLGSSTLVCELSFINILNKTDNKNLYYIAILNFIAVCAQIIMIQFFQIYQRRSVQYFEKERKCISKYSIILKKIPKEYSIEQIEDFLESKVPGSKQDIYKTYILYDLSEYDQAIHKRKQLIDKRNKIIIRKQNLSKENKLQEIETSLITQEQQIQQDLKEIDTKIQNLQQQLSIQGTKNFNNENQPLQQNDDNLKFSGRVILTFKTYQTANQIKKYFKRSSWEKFVSNYLCFFKQYHQIQQQRFFINPKYKLQVKEAPEPSDILWTGLGSVSNKLKLRIMSNILVILAMCIALSIVVVFKIIIRQQSQNLSSFWQLAMNLIAASVVALANVTIGIIIRRNAAKELRTTQTSYFVQVGKKLTKMFMVNMLLTIFIANYFVNFYVDGLENDYLKVPFDLINMVGEYFFLFITNSYISSIMSIFDIVWGVRLLKRYFLKKKLSQNTCSTSQQDTNNLMEGHPIDMALRYANVLKVILYTCAISALLPIGAPMCMVGIFIIYWADKFLIFRRMVCHNYISTLLSKQMIYQLHLSTVFFTIGNLMTLLLPVYNRYNEILDVQTLNFGYIILSSIGFMLALLFHYTPTRKAFIYNLYLKLSKSKEYNNEIADSIYDLENYIIDDYDLYHPVSKQQKLENIKKRDQQQKISSQQKLEEQQQNDKNQNNNKNFKEIELQTNIIFNQQNSVNSDNINDDENDNNQSHRKLFDTFQPSQRQNQNDKKLIINFNQGKVI